MLCFRSYYIFSSTETTNFKIFFWKLNSSICHELDNLCFKLSPKYLKWIAVCFYICLLISSFCRHFSRSILRWNQCSKVVLPTVQTGKPLPKSWNKRVVLVSLDTIDTSHVYCLCRDIHPPKPMMHIPFPYFHKMYKFLPYLRKIYTFRPFCEIYIFSFPLFWPWRIYA